MTCINCYASTWGGSINVQATNVIYGGNSFSINQAAAQFTISASAGSNGSISPSGNTSVSYGGSQTYTITASTGYCIQNVIVDGVSQGAISSYTFSNVTAVHTISASFTANIMSFSPSSYSAPGSGGSSSATASGSCQAPTGVSIGGSSSWIHATASGTTISFTVDPNPGAARNGWITVYATNVFYGYSTFSVSQAAASNYLILNPSSINFGYSGGSSIVTASGSWQTPIGLTATTSQPSWIHVSISGTTITITTDGNFGAARCGTVTVCASNCSGCQTISVCQDAAPNILSLFPSSLNAPSNGGSYQVVASGSSQTPLGLSASPGCSWVSTWVNGTTISVTVGQNSGAARSCDIWVSSTNCSNPATIHVYQAAGGLGKEAGMEKPTVYNLQQNYPNPFNPVTMITYQIPEPGKVSLRVFDLMGKEIALLENGYKNEGSYEVQFNGADFSSGIYFYELRVNNYHSIKKLILTK